MKNFSLVGISGLCLALTLTGCVGTGPNTQQGAVTGGALGALAGAVIGNNSRGGDAVGGALLGGVIGAVAGGTIGNSVDQQNGTVYGAPHARRVVRVRDTAPARPPPPPHADVVTPAPAAGAAWIPGYWDYNGYSYVWMAGHWEIPPAGSRSYVSAHWEYRPNGYAFVRPYWQ